MIEFIETISLIGLMLFLIHLATKWMNKKEDMISYKKDKYAYKGKERRNRNRRKK